MPFDLKGALDAGYTHDQVIQELAPYRKFDVAGALKAGHAPEKIAEHLASLDYPSKQDLESAAEKAGVKLTAMDRYRVSSFLKDMPAPLAEEVRTEAINVMRERKYGTWQQEYPSAIRAVQNIPENLKEIVNSFSSLLVGIPIIAYKTMQQVGIEKTKEIEREKLLPDEPVPPELEKQPLYIAEKGKEIASEIKESAKSFWKRPLKEKALLTGLAIEKHPVDTMLLAAPALNLAGRVVRAGGQLAKIEAITSTARKPLSVGNIKIERQFSKNPLTKAFIQKPFDEAMERYPQFKAYVEKYKGGKLTTDMRNTYEQLNFNERTALHKEVFEQVEKLSPKERELMIPFIEGRLHFKKDLPGDIQGLVDMSRGGVGAQFKFGGAKSTFGRGTENINPQRVNDFYSWYSGFQKKISDGFKIHEKLTPAQMEDVIYKPIELETGLSRAVIKQELGDFAPIYVHHYFPWKAKDVRGVHFAETTGKRYKPNLLKKRKGASGYSEDLTEVLPRMASSYVKWKNNQAFLEEFTQTFGLPVIKATKEGLMFNGKLYPNHKIVAPDGYLRYYGGEVDAWKEIAKRMDDVTDFDEAIIDVLMEATGPVTKKFVGVTGDVKAWLVPNEAVARLETMATPFFGTQRRQTIAKLGLDTPTQIWKDSVLAVTPRWIKNNVIGDIIFNSFEGVGPASYARGFLGKYKDVMPNEILKASFANTIKYNPQLGKAGETIIGQYLIKAKGLKPVQIVGKIKDAGYTINTAIEQPFVRALYVNIARKEAKRLLKAEGKAVNAESILTKMAEIKESAKLSKPLIDKVKKTLPVFNTLGDFGRKYGRRAIPFLNWYKFMAKYAATLPANHPFKLAGVRGLSELSEGEREEAFRQYFPFMVREIDSRGIPRRFDGLWPIGKPQDNPTETLFFNTRGMNPFSTLEDFTDMRVFSMMSPIIKVPAERALGVDTFTGQKFTTPEPMENMVHDKKLREVEKVTPPLFSHIARQFPQFELLRQFITPAKQYSTGTVFNPKPIVDPITGEPKYPINVWDKLFNYIGVDIRTIDVEDWFNKHQDRIRGKLSTTHKNLLFEPEALTLQEHIAIFNEIRSDEKLWNNIVNDIRRRAKYKGMETKSRFQTIKGGATQ